MKSARLLVLLSLAWCACAQARTYGDAIVSQVVRIYDGDTLTVSVSDWPPVVGDRISVRVRGVDTPEMRGRCPREKALARAARQFTVERVREAQVIELRNIGRDKYFRLGATVLLDGEDLGQLLIEAGLGRPYSGGRRGGWCAVDPPP